MKRLSLIVLLVAAVGLAGWATAQAPSPDEQDNPVRLKRKKRPAQEQPPAKPEKPEKPEAQPDPPDDPMKKPEKPSRPKLDEEERLDPKDDLKLPRGEGDELETLQRVARNARTSEKRIEERELGENTRELQQEILKDIDSLIERAKNDDDQNNQNDQNQNNQGGQGGQGGMSGGQSGTSGGQRQRQASSQRRQGRQSASRRDRRQRGENAASGRQQNPSTDTGNTAGGGGPQSAPAGRNDSPDRTFDQWGHLPEKERALMHKEMEQKFMDKYDDLTKQYYRIIAEKSRRKK